MHEPCHSAPMALSQSCTKQGLTRKCLHLPFILCLMVTYLPFAATVASCKPLTAKRPCCMLSGTGKGQLSSHSITRRCTASVSDRSLLRHHLILRCFCNASRRSSVAFSPIGWSIWRCGWRLHPPPSLERSPPPPPPRGAALTYESRGTQLTLARGI